MKDYFISNRHDGSFGKPQFSWKATYPFTAELIRSDPSIKTIAEIGICGGKHIEYLLKNTQITKAYGVDPIHHEGWIGEGKMNGTGADVIGEYDKFFKAVQENLDQFGEKCELVRMMSVDAAPLFEDSSLDFIFIDAIHTYDAVMDDLDAWYPKVREGGIVCGHDWEHDQFPGVTKAVSHFFDDLPHEINGVPEPVHVWWVHK